jgi:hypothetical protein
MLEGGRASWRAGRGREYRHRGAHNAAKAGNLKKLEFQLSIGSLARHTGFAERNARWRAADPTRFPTFNGKRSTTREPRTRGSERVAFASVPLARRLHNSADFKLSQYPVVSQFELPHWVDSCPSLERGRTARLRRQRTFRQPRPSSRRPQVLHVQAFNAGRFRARSRPAGRWRQSIWEGRTAHPPGVLTDERG